MVHIWMQHKVWIALFLNILIYILPTFKKNIIAFSRYQVIGNNCQDWVEWLLCEIDPELARAMYQRGVRKASETFVGQVLKQNKHWTERLPSSLNSTSLKRSVPRQPRAYFKIHEN